MGRILNEEEQRLRIIATTSSDEDTGLVNISGWKGYISSETSILFTVVDTISQSKWTRLVEHSSRRTTLKVKIPRSSVQNKILTTAELLRENSCVHDIPGTRRFTVESSSTCISTASSENRNPELLTSLCQSMSTNGSKTGLSTKIALEIERQSSDKAVLHLRKSSRGVARWLITVEVPEVPDRKDFFLLSADSKTTDFEFPTEVGQKYHLEALGLDRTGGVNICRGSTDFETSIHAAVNSGLDSLAGRYVCAGPPSHSCFDLLIEQSTFHQASVLISTNPQAVPAIHKWKISIQKTKPVRFRHNPVQEYVELATGSSQKFNFPLQFQPGHRYQVTVEPEWSDGIYPTSSTKRTVDFRAELSLEDIRELHRRAVDHAAGLSLPCRVLYRNKGPKYFDEILKEHGGIMEVYDKDNSGDPASPINLKIKGLFFMASVDNRTGKPFNYSYFGKKRICVPTGEMLRMTSNLYFADYYCMNTMEVHYVTLVMTRPGSEADRFCSKRLLLISAHDRSNNPFFFYDDQHQLLVATKDDLRVELLFTEDLDIRRYPLKNVKKRGKWRSTPGGIPKNSACTQCNLPKLSPFPKF